MHLGFIVPALIGILLAAVHPGRTRRTRRRIYWLGSLLATVSGFFIAYPTDWKSGSVIALLVAGTMLGRAYFYTPFIKINGKVYALRVIDDPSDEGVESTSGSTETLAQEVAPNAYAGLIAAGKTWWLLVVVTVISVVSLYPRITPLNAITVGVLAIIAFVFGYHDGSWGQSIARAQWIQFGVVTIITVGIFPFFYLCAHRLGRRWPLRLERAWGNPAPPPHREHHNTE
ncbi:hypothetical protein H7J07_19095 [Mycobacterium koreense]|uniref:hypothetical protein n=1 Tax=Mycolicibacillus koreensis TaxID=1069220 RepID=UPI0010564C39|nr:hypothetical protein [Mycolicibacillus koreensis]MCV7250303.1 hypothetical protein [Mycolicibacillus koreensis]BBY54642.1 hypothetical protein MKOR_18930 [Mycolicibacillus koreensis]